MEVTERDPLLHCKRFIVDAGNSELQMGGLLLPSELFNNDVSVSLPVVINQTEGHVDGKDAITALLYLIAIAQLQGVRIALGRFELQDTVDFTGHIHKQCALGD